MQQTGIGKKRKLQAFKNTHLSLAVIKVAVAAAVAATVAATVAAVVTAAAAAAAAVPPPQKFPN